MHDDGAGSGAVARAGFWSRAGGLGLDRQFDQLLLETLDRTLAHAGTGRLHLRLPSGSCAVLGQGNHGPTAQIDLHSFAMLWKAMRGGSIGFAESFMDGDFDTDDLKQVFAFYLTNADAMRSAMPSFGVTRQVDRLFHVGRRNTRSGSRRNISAHYDLGNAFYRQWLDASLCYSSAVYADAADTLEQAQQRKLACIVDALGIEQGTRVLEIGCGWGALAEALARRGARVTAITISREQLAETRARISAAGLADRVDVRFEDYRDVQGEFDRIVSIEMIEAVGEENWPRYFDVLRRRLVPGGHAVLQAITIREEDYDLYRSNPDFIQRYIFPGGMLPTTGLMQQHAQSADLDFSGIVNFGASYARTLAEWQRRFSKAWPSIEAQGFDERFRRMWIYYLTYCEIGFERGFIDVGLYRLGKSARAARP